MQRVALGLFFPLFTLISSILSYQVILAGAVVYFPAVECYALRQNNSSLLLLFF